MEQVYSKDHTLSCLARPSAFRGGVIIRLAMPVFDTRPLHPKP